jgi:hypothetical protein
MLLAVSIMSTAAGIFEPASILKRILISVFLAWQFLQTLAHLIILSIAPLSCLVVALLPAAPTRPSLAGALAGLTAACMAGAMHMAFAADDSPQFTAAAYSIAMSLVCLPEAAIGGVYLKW